MALDKFIPESPDPFLIEGADMSLAKFGHLNKVVDYINDNQISSGTASFDTINEVTTNAGVTADGVLLKDSTIALADGTVSDLSVKLGADKNNGIYGISDTQLGIAVEGVLVGGANTSGLFTGNIAEQVTNAGVTIDSALIKDGGISNSGGTMVAAFYPLANAQALSGAGAVNVTSYLTNYTSTGSAEALTLTNGTQIGQMKRVWHIVDGGSGVLTPTTLVGGTTITFTTANEFADLFWTASGWNVIALGNFTTGGAAPVLA